MSQITRGYHAAFPLFEDEITVLVGLVNLRLCTSVAIAAEQQQRQPENEYLGVSQGPIRDSLPELIKIPPRLAEALFREACGLTPVRSSPAVSLWLREHADEFGPVLEADVRTTPVAVLDLSVGSPLVGSDPAQNEESLLSPRIAEVMAQVGARVAVGQYYEPRYLYNSPAFATGSGPTDEFRTIHLGLDLFTEAGTKARWPPTA